MHIAVCDDNVADRKQLERLLKRESDKEQRLRVSFIPILSVILPHCCPIPCNTMPSILICV